MDAGRFDAFARTLARPGSRRRLLGGSIVGAVAALGGRLGLARAQTCAPLGEGCATTEECCNAVSCCGGFCLGLATFLSSSEHCGGCNLACAGTCDNGVCRPSGALNCGTGVVDTLTDASNCGGCGVACPSGFCAGGNCVPCPNGTTDCGGFCTDLSSDTAHCGQCNFNCGPGFECFSGACLLGTCPFPLEPCPGAPELCCLIEDVCATCRPDEICTGTECIGFIFEDRATCVVNSTNGFVTRDVGTASADGRLSLVARTTTEREAVRYGGEGRVRLTLAVSEGRTPQVRIDAVASRDHGVTLTTEYGPAFAGVRNLTVRSETGKAPAIDIDNRGAGATPALAVDPTFAAAAGDLNTALSVDLGACFAGGEASPVPGSPVPNGETTCQTCQDACGDALGTCFPPAGAACLADPSACVTAIVACTDAYWQCADSCAGGGSC